MKLIIKSIITLFAASSLLFSCDESILNEVPRDFLSPENAYQTAEQFNQSVNGLHGHLRGLLYPTDGHQYFALFNGTDIAFNPESYTTGIFADYSIYTSGSWPYQYYYQRFYILIAEANTVITQASGSNAKFASEEERNFYIAQGRFFRALGYRFLAHLYGGVPIIDKQISSPRKDFVRATRDEVYQFCKEDLEFASANLPRKAGGEGQITAGVADHLLSEILISLKDWDGAITAASRVIDDPQYKLMTERFGVYKDREGDVFWDLFRRGNTNRAEGNTETIYALQFKFNTPGGSAPEVAWMGYNGTRGWGPRYWTLKDPEGKSGTVAVDSLSRGASWVRPTYYAHTSVWKNSDWNDMRNSKYNIKREFWYNNPSSNYYGKKIVNLYDKADTMMAYYPYVIKVMHSPHQGDFTQAQNFRPWALFRLAETYLLRAEAKLGKGDQTGAAADINVIRARAKATPVQASQVDIDYILDERIRELLTEEYRQVTLCRLGKLYERTKLYGMEIAARTVAEKNNLWAIPQSEIDLNTEVVLPNNPGF